jgi:hypothetical protein
MSYRPPIGAATSLTQGLIKLTGDLAGTADSPTVPGLAAKLDASQKGVVNGIASLDSSGIVPSAQLPTAPVTSVAGRTGDVVLAKSDVGLTNVDNTADASKPISSATQVALDGKASLSHTHTASQISDSTVVGRAVLTATDAAAAQSALAIANTVQVVNSFAEVTTPVYGTLYVVRS